MKHQGPSFVSLEFTNKHKERIATRDYTAQQLVERIQERSQILEAGEILKKAELSNLKLEVGTRPSPLKMGISRRVPIT